jgi:hypothetical protein
VGHLVGSDCTEKFQKFVRKRNPYFVQP